jgi:folate-dependent phosphoribosylglycinamide formyltransferase PurN
MSAVILIRRSDYQNYCARRLFEAGIVSHAVIEHGQSIPSPKRPDARRLLSNAWRYLSQARSFRRRLTLLFNSRRYYGDEAAHNARILGAEAVTLPSDLPTTTVGHIGDPETAATIDALKPEIVFVFGTSMVPQQTLDTIACPVVNLHFGWSPDYRGEGIVSALALEGRTGLGVTVHFCTKGSDAGDILYQQRVKADRADNFYAVALRCAVAGTGLFEAVFRDLRSGRPLEARKQDLSQGLLYGRKYLDAHPGLYRRAWKNLKANA